MSEPVARLEASQAPWPEQAPVELSVVVPTFNERGNVGRLVAALDQALKGISWEVIFVDDDSPDETARAVIDLAAEDSRVRCLHRIGRRGLPR